MKAILTYHSIDSSRSPISVSPAEFRRHVTWLASGAVRVVPVAELVRLPASANAVALTFDDAFANFATDAAPLLAEHALPATLFVVPDQVGGTNAWGGRAAGDLPTLPLLDWHALAKLAESGVEIGAHGRSHCSLAGLDAVRLEDEVAGSVAVLGQRTGVRPAGFAYPYGIADAAAAASARSACDWACTVELRTVGDTDDAHLLPRLDMYYLRAPGRLESWGSGRFRRYLWLRSQGRQVRRRLSSVAGLQ
ncbi:MAG: polysaccharide deacetylase family protein [Gemmatimonadaceae bacterium]